MTVTVPTAPPLARVDGVELIHTGTWSISTGVWTVSPADLVAAVAALECPAVRRPVLKLGHVDERFDGQPAIGWVDGLRVAASGNVLVGDYVGMPGWLGSVIASAYPDRSIEGTYSFRCQIGHTHPFVLTAVALLGVTAPGIGTLSSLQDVGALYGVAAASAPGELAVAVRATVHAAAAETPTAVTVADGALEAAQAGGGYTLTADGTTISLTAAEADGLIDALNKVRGGTDTATASSGDIDLARDGDGVQITLDDAATQLLSDDDAYDLSYQLALWLDQAGFYDQVEAAAERKKRTWDPAAHPRGPDGRFIKKSLVPRKSDGKVSVGEATPVDAPKPKKPGTRKAPKKTASKTGDYTGPLYKPGADVDRPELAEYRKLLTAASRKDGAGLSPDEDARLFELRESLDLPAADHDRLVQEAQIEAAYQEFKSRNSLKGSDTRIKASMAKQTQEAFAGKPVAVRVTQKGLTDLLSDGRFKTQFETGKSGGLVDTGQRAKREAAWFGLAPDADPKKRPVYGYVAVGGIHAAGDADSDALSQYGQVQVVLKDEVRTRTTAMFGDSLDHKASGLPTPIDDPSWLSYTPARTSLMAYGLDTPTRDVDSPEWRAGQYAEATIHGGVTLADVDRVVLPKQPTAALRKRLDAAGVLWSVLNGGVGS